MPMLIHGKAGTVKRNTKAVCSLCGASEEGQAGCTQAGLFHSLPTPSKSQSGRHLWVIHRWLTGRDFWSWSTQRPAILPKDGSLPLPSPSPSVYSLLNLYFLFQKMRTIIFLLGSAPLRMCSEDWCEAAGKVWAFREEKASVTSV